MLTLICGVSRAGKTTYSQQFNNVIHLDESGDAFTRYLNVIEKIKQNIADVVVEGIYDTKEERKKLINAYQGNEKICIWLDVSEELINRRLAPKGFGYFYNLPFEAPSYNEGWNKIIRYTGNEDIFSKFKRGENYGSSTY